MNPNMDIEKLFPYFFSWPRVHVLILITHYLCRYEKAKCHTWLFWFVAWLQLFFVSASFLLESIPGLRRWTETLFASDFMVDNWIVDSPQDGRAHIRIIKNDFSMCMHMLCVHMKTGGVWQRNQNQELGVYAKWLSFKRKGRRPHVHVCTYTYTLLFLLLATILTAGGALYLLAELQTLTTATRLVSWRFLHSPHMRWLASSRSSVMAKLAFGLSSRMRSELFKGHRHWLRNHRLERPWRPTTLLLQAEAGQSQIPPGKSTQVKSRRWGRSSALLYSAPCLRALHGQALAPDLRRLHRRSWRRRSH